MPNPENKNNLPSPDNSPNKHFKIEIKNLKGISDFIFNDNSKKEYIIVNEEIGDDLIRKINLDIKKNDSGGYSFFFKIQKNVFNSNSDESSGLNETKKYLDGNVLNSMYKGLSLLFGDEIYVCGTTDVGERILEVKRNNNFYFVNFGFPDLETYTLNEKKHNSSEMFQKDFYNNDIKISIGDDVYPCFDSNGLLLNSFITFKTKDDFERSFNDFCLVCENLVSSYYYGFNEKPRKNKLVINYPHENTLGSINLFRERFLKQQKRILLFRQGPFDSIAGQTKAVTEAKKLVLAINNPEVYEKRGVKTPKGILFYGPPGTGKTLIAKAIAAEVNAELFEVSFSDIGSKWYGESEQKIQEVFDNANKITKTGRKAIILFDELDSMAPSRNGAYEGSKKIVSIILQNLDGFRSNKDVLIIGTTNRPGDIDPALKRPGRIDKIIAVGLPDLEDRKAILQLHINKAIERSTESHDLFIVDLNIQKIAENTEGMSGADLANIINLTLESKTVLELEGLRWKPVNDADIEKTLIDFNLKKKENKKIGFS